MVRSRRRRESGFSILGLPGAPAAADPGERGPSGAAEKGPGRRTEAGRNLETRQLSLSVELGARLNLTYLEGEGLRSRAEHSRVRMGRGRTCWEQHSWDNHGLGAHHTASAQLGNHRLLGHQIHLGRRNHLVARYRKPYPRG